MANPFNKDEQEKTEVNPEAEVVVDEKAPAEQTAEKTEEIDKDSKSEIDAQIDKLQQEYDTLNKIFIYLIIHYVYKYNTLYWHINNNNI